MRLLGELDSDLSKRLGQVYTDHVLASFADVEVPESFERAMRVAGGCLAGEASTDAVVQASRDYLKDLRSVRGELDALGTVVHLAFNLICGGVLVEVGAVRRGHTASDIGSVAKAAQVAVARRQAGADRSPGWLRWEEARWQLAALIESAPNPNTH
jgi:hypothetical protein